MPQYGESFLSRVLDEGTIAPIRENAIDELDMPDGIERKVFNYVMDYAKENRGKAPDYRTVIEKYPDFYYREQVTDSFKWLAKQIKSEAGKARFSDLINDPETNRKLRQMYAPDFFKYMREELDIMELESTTREKVGTDLVADKDKFLQEYRARKAGESHKSWYSKFGTINKSIVAYHSGNIYAWIGRSGRGKSIFVMEEALEAAFQGATVLIWALEMSWFEFMARAYSSMSGRFGWTNATIEGIDYEAGFSNRDLLNADLDEEFEQNFEQFLDELNDLIEGQIIIRAVDDEDFYRKDVRELEKDIIMCDADVVVVDPIYYMDYETNTSKTAGGDVANTSKALRGLAGRTKVVMHVITQAEEIKETYTEDGHRELKAAERSETKKAKQILEDATVHLGIDTSDGQGVIKLGKGRNGGEGDITEVIYLPNYGLVRELNYQDEINEELKEAF